MNTTDTTAQPLAPERLAEIESALPVVFAGPWHSTIDPKGFGLVMDNAMPVASVSYNLDELLPFLTSAPDVIRELLAEVKRLRAMVRRVEQMPMRHDKGGTWYATNIDLLRALYGDDPCAAEEAVATALPEMLTGLRDRLRADGHIPSASGEGAEAA